MVRTRYRARSYDSLVVAPPSAMPRFEVGWRFPAIACLTHSRLMNSR